jgi:hypothetical protein
MLAALFHSTVFAGQLSILGKRRGFFITVMIMTVSVLSIAHVLTAIRFTRSSASTDRSPPTGRPPLQTVQNCPFAEVPTSPPFPAPTDL